MKQLSTLLLMLMVSCLCANAQSTRSVINSNRYLTFKDGQVVAIPEKYILKEELKAGICTLTLEGDTTFVYSTDDIASISNNYTGTHASLKSFEFTHADNDQVYKDVKATITEMEDTIIVSADVPVLGKRLRPSFTLSEGATMWVGNEQQVSGQSSQRFTSPVVYTLAQPKHWIYQVTEVTDEEDKETDDDNIENSTEGWIVTPVDISSITTTNAPSNNTEQRLENIWDNNWGTLYHSTWGDGYYKKLNWIDGGTWGDGITEWPYLEIELEEAIENFYFSYTTSSHNDRFPQGWYITAYNTNTGSWDKIGTLSQSEDNLPQSYLTEFSSNIYTLGEEYSHVRFELTKASYKNYMVISEFALFSCIKDESMARSSEKIVKKEFVPFGRPCKVSVKYLTDHATGEYKIPTIYVTFGDGVSWNSSQWIVPSVWTVLASGPTSTP